MNTIKYYTLLFLLSFSAISMAQEDNKRLKIINAHIGIGASNLINAEAPHKIISISDVYYLQFGESNSEFNYETNFFKDMKYNFVGGIGFEYFIKPDLSLSASLNYEGKGLDIDYRHKDSGGDTDYVWASQENYVFDISNHYITLPLIMRKYLNASNTFYLQGGAYMAYLIQSSIDFSIDRLYVSSYKFDSDQLELIDETEVGGNSGSNIRAYENDFEDDLTSTFDLGIVLGTGYTYPLSDKLYIYADLLFSIGLKDIDGVNDNEYSETSLPASSGYNTVIQSENYYGLNSNAKNFSGVLTVGVGLRL
ncbi:outer membrane beta-barrel protein [Carboxylicivirga marina]|uniref:PorT family protein n=1 Tax=Carboxylicivirga marina TaxID=2800988 RepID=A0ABS1HF04_9BACT|nr:outer membrane beta-barrel protein [Carboxylicivirga marina]MBK3516248.1 PorT family protein [Carboxylicivirga marina]